MPNHLKKEQNKVALLVHIYTDEKEALVKYAQQVRRPQSQVVRELIRNLKYQLNDQEHVSE
jgi:hypothetical protein